MILERGDMWKMYSHTDLFLVTTNPIITKDKKLVMGRGMAKQMRDRLVGSDREFAKLVLFDPDSYVRTMYFEPVFKTQTVGFFMVKDHWQEPARLPIIMRSTATLMEMAHHYGRIDLNFPGIGNGKLGRDAVLSIIQHLPDNVHVWEFE